MSLSAGLSHGGVAAVLAAARKIGLEEILGEPCKARDIVMGLLAARLCHPASKIAQACWWRETTLGEDYQLAGVAKDEVCRAMDWLHERKAGIEKALAEKFLVDPVENPARLVLYDLTSTWVEGSKCELAAFGHSRDHKKGRRQIEFALIASPQGVPVGVRVFKGNTSDPKACHEAIEAIEAARDEFGMAQAVLVHGRGMVTGTRIEDLREKGLGWIGALRHQAIAALAADQGPLQMTLFDEQDLFSLTSPVYPGELLVACRNPFQAAHQAAKRERLVEATVEKVGKVGDRVEAGSLKGVAEVERAVGKVIDKNGVGKLVVVRVTEQGIS